eukprot:Platyproteum_vivax@DN8575_c0_g1_i1.p1
MEPTGDIYSGGASMVWIHRQDRPGRQSESKILSTKKGQTGQKGLVSAIAPHPEDKDVLALGSFNKTVATYDTRQSFNCPTYFQDPMYLMGGATQVSWRLLDRLEEGDDPDSYLHSDLLVSGHRQDDYLRAWDPRKPSEPLFRCPRQSNNCQRMGFDVKGDTLVTSSQDGCVLVYSLVDGAPLLALPAHSNLCSSASLNPHHNLLLSASGTRTFCDSLPKEMFGEEMEEQGQIEDSYMRLETGDIVMRQETGDTIMRQQTTDVLMRHGSTMDALMRQDTADIMMQRQDTGDAVMRQQTNDVLMRQETAQLPKPVVLPTQSHFENCVRVWGFDASKLHKK